MNLAFERLTQIYPNYIWRAGTSDVEKIADRGSLYMRHAKYMRSF